jgi:TolB-like protein/DNA-binding winged helix-turn-helix (wHTH) protein/Tfp pilus assembly protein PilF
MQKERLRFAGREFHPADGVLLSEGRRVVVSPREAATLAALIRGGGHLVDKDTLMREVWGDVAVEENNLTQQISHLRRLLGVRPDGQPLIETVPRRGYRLTVPVETVTESDGPAPASDDGAAPLVKDDSLAALAFWRRRPSRQVAMAWVAASLVVAIGVWGWWRPRSVPPLQTLVVLPFHNLTGESANDYLVEGLTDEITTELARAAPAALRVIARASAARLRGSPDGVRGIAARVGATLVLEGSVRRDGDVLRVTAQLSEAESETQIWARSYDQRMGGLLALERTLAQSVASTVRVSVIDAGTGRAEEVPPEARDAYLRARYFHQLASVPSLERAIEAYQQAVRLAPDFALAHAGLARAYVFSTRTQPRIALERARESAREALRLASSLPEARLASAIALLYADRDLTSADAEFRRAIAMDEGAAEPRFYHAQMLTAAGRFDEALEQARAAVALDPYSPLVHHYVGRILLFARRPREAVAHLERTVDLDPTYAWTRMFLAVAHEQAGELDKALDQRERYWALMGVASEHVETLRGAFERDGYAGVRRAWAEWIAGFEQQRGFPTSTERGLLHAALGETDLAFDALGRAADAGVRDLIYLRVYPELDQVRGDPRFAALVRRVFTDP